MSTTIREGDTVLHRPSGETLIVAAVLNESELIPSGFECAIKQASDCELNKPCGDAEHLAMLRACAVMSDSVFGSGDPRKVSALRKLAAPPSPKAGR